MANRYEGEVSIRLDRVRKLKFTTRALAAFQESHGMPWQRFLMSLAPSEEAESARERLASGDAKPGDLEAAMSALTLDLAVIRRLLWAGLIHEDKDLTEDDVLDLMDYVEGENQSHKEAVIIAKVLEAFFSRVAPQSVREMRGALKSLEEATRDLSSPTSSDSRTSEPTPSGTGSLTESSGS